MALQLAQILSKDAICTNAAWLQIERLKQNWYSTAADVINMSEVSTLPLIVTENVHALVTPNYFKRAGRIAPGTAGAPCFAWPV